jgi:hypothetical protein
VFVWHRPWLCGLFPVWGFAVARDAFKSQLDNMCGLAIIICYFLYFMLVKGALGVFDCSRNKDGVYILDADPSIICNEVGVVCNCGYQGASCMCGALHRRGWGGSCV